MPAPKGNKYALGNECGRPRERDREKLANDLLEWAKRDESINLNEFCCLFCEPILAPSMLYKLACEDHEFRKTYDVVKAFIGFRREKKLNNNELHVKAYDLNATTYDFFLKQEKRQQAEFEAELKKGVQEVEQANLVDLLKAANSGKIKQIDA